MKIQWQTMANSRG